jgi:hypothetical protein
MLGILEEAPVSEPLPRHTVIIIVRVWEEYLHQAPPAWRGVITRVDDGTQCYFGDLQELMVAVQSLCTPPEEAAESTADR